MNPTEVVIDAVIGGVKRKLYFNWNAYAKFEEFSSIQENGKRLNFTKFVFQLYALIQKAAAKTQAIGENATSEDSQRVLLEAIGELGVTDIRALICGACHVYDREDNPSWPLSPGQLGRIMTVAEMSEAIPKIVSAVMRSNPQASDEPKKGGEESVRPIRTSPSIPTPSTTNDGGSTSGELDEGPLALLTVKSGA